MKRTFRTAALVLIVALLLSMSAGAVHNRTTWMSLNETSTFLEPYTNYESVLTRNEQNYLFADYAADLQTLQAQYPDLMRVEVIGYSELGRPLYAVVMGKDSAPNRMLVMANTHAREYITSQLCMLQIEFYLHNYYNMIEGERVCDLMERCQYYFIPMHNPDGAQLAMVGLKSLNDPEVTVSSSEKAEIRKFLISQLGPMHVFCEGNYLYHDTDAKFFTNDPNPEYEDAFQYWKTNIRGVDLHNSMYNPTMRSYWSMGNASPSWTDYNGNRNTSPDGTSLSTENTALRKYVDKIQPNILLSYHTASGVIQWGYGYGGLAGHANDSTVKTTAYKLSYKAGELLNYYTDDTDYGICGHPGWFMLNSLNYMDSMAYGVTLEFASRRYLNAVGDYPEGYVDAPPSKVIQLMDDVQDVNGTQRYSLWTTGRFFPLSFAQFVIDNRYIAPVGALKSTEPEGTDVAYILDTYAPNPTPKGDLVDFGTYQCKVEGKTSIVPGDILTTNECVRLYDANFSKQQDSIAINGSTQVHFTYINYLNQETKAVFTVEPYPETLAFTDIAKGETFYDDIRWAFANGLMNGKTATTFDRKSNLTRQQVWRVMSRAVTGSDVGSMAAAKDWAVANGIADGTLPGTAATRAEVVTMMWKAFGKASADTSKISTYADAASVPAEAQAAMAWAIENGIVGGYDDNTLRPNATITRGAFCAILHRYLGK